MDVRLHAEARMWEAHAALSTSGTSEEAAASAVHLAFPVQSLAALHKLQPVHALQQGILDIHGLISVWLMNGWMPDGSREAVLTDLNVGPGHPSGRVLVHAGDNAILHLHSACVSQRGGRPSKDAEGHCHNTSEPQSPALLPSTAHEKSPLTAEASHQCCRSSGKHLNEWIAVL